MGPPTSPGQRAHGAALAPPSKSHGIRLLIAAALAGGPSVVRPLPDSGDVRATLGALRGLGFEVEVRDDPERPDCRSAHVVGTAGRLPAASAQLDVRGSGTALRLLAGLCARGAGEYVLGGDAALSARPCAGVAAALSSAGASARTDAGCPPLTVSGPLERPPRRAVRVPVAGSSQPLSSVGLLAASVPGTWRLVEVGRAVSRGYVGLTRDVVAARSTARWRRVGSRGGPGRHVVEGGVFLPDADCGRTPVEGDWSSAAYALVAAAVTGGDVTVRGLRAASSQPDRLVARWLRRGGAEVSVRADSVRVRGPLRRAPDVSLRDAPDLAPLIAAAAATLPGSTRVFGAPHLRDKESDRIAATAAAVRALGGSAEEREDGFVVTGRARGNGTVETRGDHRIAMAFAVAGLALPGVVVDDPACVAKSHPGFHAEIARLTSV